MPGYAINIYMPEPMKYLAIISNIQSSNGNRIEFSDFLKQGILGDKLFRLVSGKE